MKKLLWWHVAVLGTAGVLSALLILEDQSLVATVGAFCSIALFIAAWFVFGRKAETDRRYAIALIAATVVAAGVGAGFTPAMAILQTVAFPLIWFFAGELRTALIGNILLAVGVGVGFLFSLGTTTENLEQTAITVALSLGLSLALGLWFTRVYDQVNERQRLIDELTAAQKELAALSRDAGISDERERLAREIHDTIAQDLTGLVLTAQRGRRELAKGNSAAVEKQLAILEENARHALIETRALVASGAAVGVDGGGLALALRRLAERFERETGIVVTVSADESATADRDAEVVLLRCAQEALANVRKHSSAGTAAVALSAHDGEIDLKISDDGAGFDPAKPSSGFGLTGLRERLALVRGTLALNAEPGGGTTLVATLPRSAQLPGSAQLLGSAERTA
jgi:signal transduction histidine kinase